MTVLPGVSIDEAWSDLRRHLEWTPGEGTVVFIAVDSLSDAQDLRERAELWARRARVPWSCAPQESSVAAWLRTHLPTPGVLWVELREEGARLPALHALNEMRSRLAHPGSGCLVLSGPVILLEQAPREAIDLWSIRSFAHVVSRRRVATDPSSLHITDRMGDGQAPQALSEGRYRSTWRISLPEEMRSPEAAVLMRRIERVRQLLGNDPLAARTLLESVPDRESDLARVLEGLVRAEIAGLLDDVVSVERLLLRAMEEAEAFPPAFRWQVDDAGWEIATAFGALDAAMRAAQGRMTVSRELVGVLGTPEARRDLSVALDNVGGVAQARGLWQEAGAAYEESLELRRELVGVLGTPQARRDLSVSLNKVGGVAQARGLWQEAGAAYEESLELRRELARTQGTPTSYNDLLLSLDSSIRVAEAQGESERAAALRDERAEVEEMLGAAPAEASESGPLENR
ncbi:tetratricopeptide repeat protein [Actinomyces bowdenii]|uniref:tetratricopeptide repeat protein n=1 Tax=Actinomyces bowdenii TaxID=131109 RepID=UPI001ABCA292|nr:tetratricopeptide repeat protein [Actinomyces bowdenii]MBO3725745.1 tetratricopeptide repeat protein [Actinomyces bowdenii]